MRYVKHETNVYARDKVNLKANQESLLSVVKCLRLACLEMQHIITTSLRYFSREQLKVDEEEEGKENLGMIRAKSGHNVVFLHWCMLLKTEWRCALIADDSIMTP